MKKVAICIVTYNRAEAIEDICPRLLENADKEDTDIYVYDSSENDQTQLIINNCQKKYKNLFYNRISSHIHSSRKLYDIYRNKYIQDNYAYLWVLPDYLSFSPEVMRQCKDSLDMGYDMIMLDWYDYKGIGDRVCPDKNEIFKDYAWALTHYGIIILNCETVLKNCDWDYLTRKYLTPNHRYFSHVTMYFEQMFKMESFRFYHLRIQMKYVHISGYKKNVRNTEEFLNIWGYCWPKSIYALPEYYRNKEAAVNNLSRYGGHLGTEDLLGLKSNGVLTGKVFWRFLPRWKLVSQVSAVKFFLITYLPECVIEKAMSLRKAVLLGKMGDKIKKRWTERQFIRFCQRHRILYIYGAGIRAERYAGYLDKMHVKYRAFIVTELSGKNRLMGHRILRLSDIKLPENTGIIVAVNENNQKEVVPFLNKKGYKKNLFIKNIVMDQ